MSLPVPGFECSDAVRAKARQFVEDEKPFHLGFLPTEQSNPITATLEDDFRRSTLAGVQCLQRADRQIPITMRHVFASDEFEKLVASMAESVKGDKGRIVFSGSCAMEAALCRVLPRLAKETAADYAVAFERLLAGLESPAGRKLIADEIDFEEGVYRAGGRLT